VSKKARIAMAKYNRLKGEFVQEFERLQRSKQHKAACSKMATEGTPTTGKKRATKGRATGAAVSPLLSCTCSEISQPLLSCTCSESIQYLLLTTDCQIYKVDSLNASDHPMSVSRQST